MAAFNDDMQAYRRQMEKGAIPRAYKGLMEYILALRAHFKKRHPDYLLTGGVYLGYMDMTYFPIIPSALKARELKIAIVFIHETCRFEAWLAAVNKQVQTKYWKLFKDNAWDRYRLVATPQGADAIVEHVLVERPDFGDLQALTAQIEGETLRFIEDVEEFLAGK